MKTLNGDWLIEIMSKPEHSDEVLDLLELCELERVDMKSCISDEIRVEKYGIELDFSWSVKSEKQRAEAEQGNLYFQGVSFFENCTIPLPFGLKKGDSRKVATQKINENAKIIHIFRYEMVDSILLEDSDKKYFFKVEYTTDADETLFDIYTFTWNIDMDLNRNYMKTKITLEEALHG